MEHIILKCLVRKIFQIDLLNHFLEFYKYFNKVV